MPKSSHSLTKENVFFRNGGLPLSTDFQESQKQPFPFHLPLSFSLLVGRSKLWLFPSCESMAISHDH